jgi:hypothetical protein
MDKLRAPDKFNLDARNLADAWKKWKEELIILGVIFSVYISVVKPK